MSIQREIEVKRLISEFDFSKLKMFLKVTDLSSHTQTNHYFDTTTYALSFLHHASLRVREVGNSFILTLKIDDLKAEGKLEIEQEITKRDFQSIQDQTSFPNGDVLNQLHLIFNQNIPPLSIYNSLTTIRYEQTYYGGLLCLDENHYHGVIDYEVEYETNSMAYGKKVLTSLFRQLNIISAKEGPSKVKRAFLQMKNEGK